MKLVQEPVKAKGLKVKTKVQAGLGGTNHNETLVVDAANEALSSAEADCHPYGVIRRCHELPNETPVYL